MCRLYLDLINRFTRTNLIQLISRHGFPIHHLVFYSNKIDKYYIIIKQIIEQRISLHTMQFIIMEGKQCIFFFKFIRVKLEISGNEIVQRYLLSHLFRNKIIGQIDFILQLIFIGWEIIQISLFNKQQSKKFVL